MDLGVRQRSGFFRRHKLNEMVKAYWDLDKTLNRLTQYGESKGLKPLRQINVGKLILQLGRSKKRLRRKIGNTLLLEKQQLKKQFRKILKDS